MTYFPVCQSFLVLFDLFIIFEQFVLARSRIFFFFLPLHYFIYISLLYWWFELFLWDFFLLWFWIISGSRNFLMNFHIVINVTSSFWFYLFLFVIIDAFSKNFSMRFILLFSFVSLNPIRSDAITRDIHVPDADHLYN